MAAKQTVQRRSSVAAKRTTSATMLTPYMLKLLAPRLALGGLLYSLIYLTAWGVGQVMRRLNGTTWADLVDHPDRPAWLTPEDAQRMADAVPVSDITAVISILAGFVVFAIARWSQMSSKSTLWLATGFQILSCFGIALAELWGPHSQSVTGISWVCFWIPIFPMLVPMPPIRGFIAALLAAAMVPFAYLVTYLSLGENDGGEWMFSWFFPPGIAALGAYFATRFVYRLSRDASKAQRLGSYTLVDKLGQGGMGEVWRAEHKLLARPAAVKLIRREAIGGDLDASTTIMKRFEREARATSGLESPNTIELYDFGVSDDGTFFYVMELLDGIDLERLAEQFGPQPAERVTYILQQACNSLNDAHNSGLLHRDIKPANIFVCRKAFEYDFVKVLDFGLVKELQRDTAATRLTADGIVSGTPAYMAPETAKNPNAVDPRSDLYSLACVGYWLLTGRLVFGSRNPMDMLVAHVSETPDPPSIHTELPIPADFEALMMRCLSKNPADRPASAAAMRAELADCSTADKWTQQRAEKWWRVHLRELVRESKAPTLLADDAKL
jgi:serine/threonine-protein kinase